jgi:uncharacterized protein involved in exopolysaccharide biosynthesis
LFGLTFLLTLLAGLVWIVLQPANYRSVATVLISAPRAIDAKTDDVDIQNVAIQRKILLGNAITERIQSELQRLHQVQLSAEELSSKLQVEAVAGTNVIEFIAAGTQAELLPELVNIWLDVYLAVRAEEVALLKNRTLDEVEGELVDLDGKLQAAREALDQYRRANEIISAQREENEVLARLDGLNSSLNNAIEEEVTTRAYMETLLEAIRRGEQVVPRGEQTRVAALEVDLRKLQREMAELSKRYTMEYINKQPQMRAVIERTEEVKAELASILSAGSETELFSARQAHAAARQSVADLQAKLDVHKQRVADFTRIYAKHEALVDDLARLEELNRETQTRQVQVEILDLDKYPQVSIIQRPSDKSLRTGPDYLVLTGAVLLASFIVGIICVWLYGFLGHSVPAASYVPIADVHLHAPKAPDELGYSTEIDSRRIDSDPNRLEGPDEAGDVQD